MQAGSQLALERAEITQLSNEVYSVATKKDALERAEITQLSNAVESSTQSSLL